jgi:molecular chaperone GrpE
MSARRPEKDEHPDDGAPSDGGGVATDDEIEILEVVGVNETEPVGVEPVEPHAPAPPAAPDLTGELDETRREKEHYHDLWLRQQADFDNFRKRSERDAELRRLADAAGIVGRLLPVLDNLERAIAAAGDRDDPFRQGLILVHQQMLDLLGREGLAPVATEGTRFDPRHHEAVETVPSEDIEDGMVLGEMQRGYMFKDRLLRPALVRVATGRGRPGEGGEPAAGVP